MKVLYQCEICEAIHTDRNMAVTCENQQTGKHKYKVEDIVKCGGLEVRISSLKFGVFDHAPLYCYYSLTSEGREIGPISDPVLERWFSKIL